ncbi:hypothetical protein [Virgibacillus halodenitrificans]|uniref:hypothetical protein n=1 Tax=Virgibacillus halodenitrificans TaxID=1482 RepID=UPI000EF4C0E6|nr:hypothetical protein [Virgibacillus halodenitrificans]MYL57488.1 hypothetical protein [Virgibacillus halodenitrificans]
MVPVEKLLTELSKKRFEAVSAYPSVARRLLHAVKRSIEAESVEEVNEVGLNCREVLNDYAKQIYSHEFSNEEMKKGNTKQLLKETINYYTSSGEDRAVVSSLNDLVDKVTRGLHSITHSSTVYPEHAFLSIDLCFSLISAIEGLILSSERKGNPTYEHFGVIKCPSCKSLKLETFSHLDERRDEIYYIIECKECGWGEWTQ